MDIQHGFDYEFLMFYVEMINKTKDGYGDFISFMPVKSAAHVNYDPFLLPVDRQSNISGVSGTKHFRSFSDILVWSPSLCSQIDLLSICSCHGICITYLLHPVRAEPMNKPYEKIDIFKLYVGIFSLCQRQVFKFFLSYSHFPFILEIDKRQPYMTFGDMSSIGKSVGQNHPNTRSHGVVFYAILFIILCLEATKME